MNPKFVENAIETMNRNYLPAILKLLKKQDACSTVTVTVNTTEIKILKALVSNRIGELHREWYDATHDETETNAQDLAYELYRIEEHHRQVCKLYNTICKAEEQKEA